MSIWNVLTIGSGFLLIILVLLQTRGASLGAGLGGGGDVNTVRRGSDKTIHNITVIAAIVFVLSVVVSIILE
jgi:preprotein translocase subunit SecG